MVFKPEEGYYMIINKTTQTAIDLCGGQQGQEVAVWGWAKAPKEDFLFFDQVWSIRKIAGTEYYQIINVRGGTVLDLFGGKTDDGTRVYGYKFNGDGSTNQYWFFEGDNPNSLEIENAMSHTVLDLKDEKNGTFLTGWARDPNRHQKWVLQKIKVQEGQ